MDKFTAQEVTKRCAELGFHITKDGFAQSLADMMNESLKIGSTPLPIYSATSPIPIFLTPYGCLTDGWRI